MKPLLITHPDCENHVMPRHPERPERLSAVMQRLKSAGLTDEMELVLANEITHDALARVHPDAFIRSIESSEPSGDVVRVDPDTFMSPGSTRAAKLAAGACVEAVERVLTKEAKNSATNIAFCAVRPPGHHAEIAGAMGFCLFNTVAAGAMAALAQPGIDRVAILDFDVHHCNGTVDIFKDDERVLVCSSFQDHFYPHRYLDFSNDHIVATPLAGGANGAAFRAAVEKSWIPAVEAHKPQLILVSAGFDAHRNDPVGGLELLDDDYRWVTELITSMAADHAEGRVVSTMEGGYDLDSLAASAATHVAALVAAGR